MFRSTSQRVCQLAAQFVQKNSAPCSASYCNVASCILDKLDKSGSYSVQFSTKSPCMNSSLMRVSPPNSSFSLFALTTSSRLTTTAVGEEVTQTGLVNVGVSVSGEDEDEPIIPDPSDPEFADFEELVKTLMHPIPLGRKVQPWINPYVVLMNGIYFLDPRKALETMIRALYVIKQVLKSNGYVYIVNSHELMKPLIREAALCSINPNVWWYYDDWEPGTLSVNKLVRTRLFQPEHQPNRDLLASRGIKMVNPHCPRPHPLDKPRVTLDSIDKQRLWYSWRNRKMRERRALLERVFWAEVNTAKIPLSNSLQGPSAQIQLMVILDATINSETLVEAHKHNIPTVSVVNANTHDVSSITFPVLAREFHPKFHHFFLNWILKLVNLPSR